MKRFVLLMFLILLPAVAVIAQPRISSLKEETIRRLKSGDTLDIVEALYDILEQNIPEAIPVIEGMLLHETRCTGARMLFLAAMYKSPNYISLAHQYLDAVDTMRSGGFPYMQDDPLQIKYEITRRLIKRNDFSTYQYVFDLARREKPKAVPGISIVLERIIKNLPEQEYACKSELQRIAKETNSGEHVEALAVLCRLYGKEFIRLTKDTFTKTSDEFLASRIIEILLNYKDDELKDLLCERLLRGLPSYKNYAELILQVTPEPYVYQWLLTSPQIPASQRKDMDLDLHLFQPPDNDSSSSILQSIKNLRGLVDTSFGYRWIGNAAFVSELKECLDTSISKLNRGDSLSCTMDIQKFKRTIIEKHEKTNVGETAFVHEGGWNFLSTNAEYILDKLPPYISDTSSEVACFPVGVPVGSNSFILKIYGKHFAKDSKVLVSDSSRATTFVSDSLLTIKMSSGDLDEWREYKISVQYTASPLSISESTFFYVGPKEHPTYWYCGTYIMWEKFNDE